MSPSRRKPDGGDDGRAKGPGSSSPDASGKRPRKSAANAPKSGARPSKPSGPGVKPGAKPGAKAPRSGAKPPKSESRTKSPVESNPIDGSILVTGDLLAGVSSTASESSPPSQPPARVPADQDARDLIRTLLDETIVVEAAAGTGKTTMLVERIVALLASGRAEVGRIVAVTFTEKAAGELKLRIRERLESARQEAEPGTPARGCLEQALSRLEEAWVGTIHGFCADLLRERSVAANVDPDYRTLTEPEAMKLFQEAFDLWLQQVLENPPEGVRRSLRRGGGGRDGDGPVGRLRHAAWSLVEWRDFPHPWRRDPFPRERTIDHLVERLHGFAASTHRCDQPARDNFYHDTEKYRSLSQEIRSAESVRERDYDGIEASLIELRRGWPPRKGYGKAYGAGISRAEVADELSAFSAELEAFERDADADLAALLHAELSSSHHDTGGAVVPSAIEAYESRKARLGLLDFVDLLIKARDLIREDAEVRAEFQDRFTHLFVDEFQDTDPIQAEILMLLAAEDSAVWNWQFVVPQPGKLFIVGDPKQSIYRFRRADVSIYRQVRAILERHGGRCLQLTTNFRTVENIQTAINTAFAPWMTGDEIALQAEYVPLTSWRSDRSGRPSLIGLPVPRPYGVNKVTKTAIDASLPGAVASFVKWLLEESGWTVTETSGQAQRERRLQPRDVCLLFRRFDNFFLGDITRGYVRALESRGVRHLLVGGRSFHEREEVETVRTALTAIEWPDDELTVFATLRGAFFAIGDEELFEFRRTFGKLHPFRHRGGAALPGHLEPIDEALRILGGLHRARNSRPIAETVSTLLELTRAHATFVLRPSGDQVLANVLHVAEQARSYESSGGISFRGFVEELLADADRRTAPEAPILEEGSDGVRIMTVHRAKGLEFPVVILCDMTANLSGASASRYLDSDRRFCVSRLAGWSPVELLEHEDEELQRDRAEGVRVAYVAATRARDLLVVPGLGTERFGDPSDAELARATWLFPLNGALYSDRAGWGRSGPAVGCPAFGPATVSGGDPSRFDFEMVRPGLHEVTADGRRHEVVWWDADLVAEDEDPLYGVRRDDLMKKEVDPEVVGNDLARFQEWEQQRSRTLQEASYPSLRLATVTERARLLAESGKKLEVVVDVVELEREGGRPAGVRFGALVHAVLATVPLSGDRAAIERATDLQGRLLGATDREVAASIAAVGRVLAHELLSRARAASVQSGHCLREVPVTSREADGTILDGVIDLTFLEGETWVVVDFKTDRELELGLDVYKRQVALYAAMLSRATKQQARGVLLRV